MYLLLNNYRTMLLFCFSMVLLMLICPDAMAASTEMPWDAPLEKIADSLTGPVAGAISLVAIFVSGALLIFGGEMGEFARRCIMLVMVISLVICASSFLETLFKTNTALV